MSVAEQIERIQMDRNTIRNKLVSLGMATSTDNLDALAAAIDGMVNQGAVSVEILEGKSYAIPAGYHNGSGIVKAMTDTAGEAEKYKTQAKSVTPTKKQQSVTPDSGYYAMESVTVGAIPDNYQDVSSVTAEAADVLTGKIIVGADGAVVAGTMVNNGAVSKTLSATADGKEYTIPAGYHNGEGSVSISLEAVSVIPKKILQTVKANDGRVLSSVSVRAIPSEYQKVTEVDATAADVLDGKKIVDADGTVVTGTMANNGDVSATFDGLTTTSVTIPAGYTSGGTVSLTADIEEALAVI